MDRPTPDELEEAMGHAQTLAEMVADGSRTEASILPSEMNLMTLAAEVRALREENEMLHAEFSRVLIQREDKKSQLTELREAAERFRLVLRDSDRDAWHKADAELAAVLAKTKGV